MQRTLTPWRSGCQCSDARRWIDGESHRREVRQLIDARDALAAELDNVSLKVMELEGQLSVCREILADIRIQYEDDTPIANAIDLAVGATCGTPAPAVKINSQPAVIDAHAVCKGEHLSAISKLESELSDALDKLALSRSEAGALRTSRAAQSRLTEKLKRDLDSAKAKLSNIAGIATSDNSTEYDSGAASIQENPGTRVLVDANDPTRSAAADAAGMAADYSARATYARGYEDGRRHKILQTSSNAGNTSKVNSEIK